MSCFSPSLIFRLFSRLRERRRHTASINYKVKLKLNSTPNNASCCKRRCSLALCLDLLGLCLAGSQLRFSAGCKLPVSGAGSCPGFAIYTIYIYIAFPCWRQLMQPACCLLPLSLLLFVSVSLVLDGAQVCLPMVAIHYHAGDIFVLASESSCQQKPIIVILSLKCCHCQCHSQCLSQCLLGLASCLVSLVARLLRLLFIDFKCNKRHCAAASIICTPSEC